MHRQKTTSPTKVSHFHNRHYAGGWGLKRQRNEENYRLIIKELTEQFDIRVMLNTSINKMLNGSKLQLIMKFSIRFTNRRIVKILFNVNLILQIDTNNII